MYLDLTLHFQYPLYLYSNYHFKYFYLFTSFLSCLSYNILPVIVCLEFCSSDTLNK